jgi:oligoribonuclease
MGGKSDNLVWIDLEMTGLDTARDHIIEVATIVTDGSLNMIAEGPVLAIHQTDAVLEQMDEWNRTTHGASGLLARVRESTLSAADAEKLTLEFLMQHASRGASPMCGNSICQDRRFLAREMPELESFFHYRNLDVSTLKELARRWAPDVFAGVKKTSTHLALEDIRDSVKELEHYKRSFLRL